MTGETPVSPRLTAGGSTGGGLFFFSVEQFHDRFIQLSAGGLALLGARDVAYVDFDASAGGAQVDRRLRGEILDAVAGGSLLPFFFGHVRVALGFFHHQFLNGLNHWIWVLSAGH